MPKLNRIFIANRGEICSRIAATAQRLGLETVAICDVDTPPNYLASLITEFARVESEDLALYLNGPKLIDLALKNGCDGVHPGFGFLSENADFANAVAAAGLKWIGPSAGAIGKMASKATARSLAIAADVPCVPGLQDFRIPAGETGDFSALEAFAKQAGFPLIIKAALGGGGKGMRLVRTLDELKAATLRAYSEAKNSFGDGALIIERYVESPRHIEVQILGDQFGNIYAIGDRDCSVQRRHQKILEEAPAPFLNARVRSELHECAVSLARAVGYSSAGTVEFLLDESLGREQQKFYFLEMNTRLQVEHPVTEEVYGLDLVEWQFRVAMDERLPDEFANLVPRGHSIEARLYAEDVAKDFFPAPGPVFGFLPGMGPGIRWEIGLDTVDVVSPKYDPMVAKCIATGASREIAVAKLAQALSHTVFAAGASNREFLVDICRDTEFCRQAVGTHFIPDNLESILEIGRRKRVKLEEIANFVINQLGDLSPDQADQCLNKSPQVAEITRHIFNKSGPLAQPQSPKSQLMVRSEATSRSLSSEGILRCRLGHGAVTWENRSVPFQYSIGHFQDASFVTVNIDGRQFRQVNAAKGWTGSSTGQTASSDEIAAPVPGKVIKVRVESGSALTQGSPAFVLESMKMEFEVKAAIDGVIADVRVKEGDQVSTGDILATWAETTKN